MYPLCSHSSGKNSVFQCIHFSPFITFIVSCLSTPFYQQFDVFAFTKPLATYRAAIQQCPLPRSFKVSTMNQSFYHTYYHALGLSAHIICCFQHLTFNFSVYLHNWILTYFLPFSCCLFTYIFSSTTCFMYTQICYIL